MVGGVLYSDRRESDGREVGGVLNLKVTPSDQGGKILSTDANGITEGQFKKLTIKGKCTFKDGW